MGILLNGWRVCEVAQQGNLGERSELHTRPLADPKGESAKAGEEFRTPPKWSYLSYVLEREILIELSLGNTRIGEFVILSTNK